ncbi:hypothetical protein, partial [Nocardia brasiliensis]|uniref:hypothetical protein n=1 Tax=Nocardia brasiliensis TaxID=37326 RepID=UPI002457525C
PDQDRARFTRIERLDRLAVREPGRPPLQPQAVLAHPQGRIARDHPAPRNAERETGYSEQRDRKTRYKNKKKKQQATKNK